MNGHTPGPWRLENRTVWAPTDDDKQNRFWLTVHSVGRTALGEAGPEEVLANAALCAAAPDLLAALEAYQAANRIHNDSESDLFDLGEAAIARARPARSPGAAQVKEGK